MLVCLSDGMCVRVLNCRVFGLVFGGLFLCLLFVFRCRLLWMRSVSLCRLCVRRR